MFMMFKVKNTNMHVTYTPEAQIFVPLNFNFMNSADIGKQS